MNKINILNVSIDNLTQEELLLLLKEKGGVVVTPNVDHLIKLQKDPEFHHIYQEADYRVCDSQIVKIVSKWLGSPIREKISGSDLFPAFYTYFKDDPDTKIFLLGAAEGVAHKAQKNINSKLGRDMVIGSYSPSYGFEKNEAECQKIIEMINESGATVLAVGVGAPKQEKWISKYKNQLPNIKVFMAIGATLDFEAGNRPRSPEWMSKYGVEWAFRLMSEPKRLWKRYLVEDLPFFLLVFQQKLNLYQYKSPIGQLLKTAGLISSEQVEEILQEQAYQRHLRFGDLLARRGWVKPETVDFFAEELPQLETAHPQQPLGQYLKKAALLNDDQITRILNYQRQTGMKFGEIAVLKGWVKQETIDWFLETVKAEHKVRSLEDKQKYGKPSMRAIAS
ncbi:WecB/TagA/CpsF family glycosyltransferase [Laspinema olomoucense]|uniref:WecB/TagA/CpsF family glycosyltransferase n=1 Tax=Laspinema olomoucense D3b TaxID=2953688 RepID=A0ABT2NIJ3_9CYAN|nr:MULTISPECIES: WecB/TagA/CpsF family glycosyltransferase [unclassified Laspinema]MCT7973527.1 WecB/TagA/CpsF family glycosyltransferase [Laspinema sp. D3d]MCT7981111.1 WecB/TagA/CpsF family glycosyltransferase [Laspinema sp. D3b]MCT7987989.1 WecB/TagA/CpsF family glycosyltransferase [Laspinema sp. D3a]